MKTNINRPFLKREDIMNHSNFKDVLLKSKSVRNPFYKSAKFFAGMGIAASVILVVYFYQTGRSKPFIVPPLAGVNVPSVQYSVNPLQDTTLVYSTGSSITIPANTFMDKKGNLVSENVDVHYREFHNAVEFFASGIPMSYDSGGVSYTFQSAGMMEIEAYHNGEKLVMNPEKKISVSLASDQTEDKFNLYVLDTVARKWVYKGRSNSIVNQPSELVMADSAKVSLDTLASRIDSMPVRPSLAEQAAKEIKRLEASKPLEPKKATKDKYRFTLAVDSAEFPEIAVYKNLMFEVGAENTNFDRKTDQTTWENVVLKENKKGRNYMITLSKNDRAVTYIVYPVFDGKNYEEAMQQYRVKYSEYEKKLAAKQAQQERLLAEAKKQEAKLRYEEERQAVIDQENQRRMDEAQKISDAEAKVQQELMAQQRNDPGLLMAGKDASGMNYMAVRQRFAISGFGIWNSDCPYKYESPATLQAAFKDQRGNDLPVQQAFMIDRKRNMLFTHYIPFSTVQFDPKSENVMFVVLPDERIAYFDSKQFREMSITNGSYTFIMQVSDKKYKTVKEVKEMLGV